MRIFIATAFLFAFSISVFAEGVGIGETEITPDASAIFEVASTNRGALFPRMSTAQRLAIPAPATGLLVYDIDDDAFFYKTETEWRSLATPNETPNVSFHISSPSGSLTPTVGGLQPIVMTSTNSNLDFVEGGCIKIDNNCPGFSQTIAYFVAPIDGIYSFQAQTLLQGNASAVSFVLVKNGSQVEVIYALANQAWYPLSYSATHKLAAGDAIAMALNAPVNLNIYNTPYTFFSGHLVKPIN